MLILHNHKRLTLIKWFSVATILPIAAFLFSRILTINSVLAVTHEIPEGYTTIVDPVFYDCIVEEFISEFPDEPIAATGLTDQQLAQIDSLVCDNYNQTEKITDAIGLEKMTGLTYLNLNSNNLSEIDVTKNTKLTSLYLYNNNLSEIDVTQNTSLTTLLLHHNNLSEIDVTKNTGLTDLRLQNNNLSEIDVTKNTNLTRLELNSNNLSEIDVTKNTNLTDLDLGSNNLSEIDVTKNANLTQLSLYSDNLSEIDVTKNTNLTYLNLNSNNLSEIDVTENTKLISLYLYNTNLSEIDVTKNTNLTYLDLNSNNLSEIDITENTNLTRLELGSNNLSEIDVTKNTNLTDLYLSENSIFDFSSTEYLALDHLSLFSRQSKTVGTESTTYVLPPLFTQVKTEGWGAGFANSMYTDQPFILTNATLSSDGKSITMINPDEPATIEIDGGMAGGSILTLNYTGPKEYAYTLSFDANGGANAPAALTYGPTAASFHTFTIPTDEPTYSGYTFLGWADTADATIANQDYAPSSTITIYANKTLYAVWEESESEPESESAAQTPDTGLTTGEKPNGTNSYSIIIISTSLVLIGLVSVYAASKVKAKKISKHC